MKKVYKHIAMNLKWINLTCLLSCLIPIFSGCILWKYLPAKLICWDTETASMTGFENKFEVIIIYPLIAFFTEFLVIKLLDMMIDQLIVCTFKLFLPLFVLITSVLTLYEGINNLCISMFITIGLLLILIFAIEIKKNYDIRK